MTGIFTDLARAVVAGEIAEGMDPARLYRIAARRTHPDAGGSDAAFNEVQEAWRVLGKAPSGGGS